MQKKQNIVCFVADQMRSDSLAHLGNPASVTPNLDAICEEGVSFANAYCQNPVCVPSRCSFLTGLYPHTLGHRTMHFLQNQDEPNILKEMKNNGYEVIWIGRNDVIPSDRLKTEYCDEYYDGYHKGNQRDVINEGFVAQMVQQDAKPEKKTEKKKDELYSFYLGKLPDGEGYGKADWTCVQEALNYIERKSKNPSQKPFFLYCTISFPHPPYGCEDPWYSMIDRSKLPPRRPSISSLLNKPSMLYSIAEKQGLTWSEEHFDELRATYLAMVARFDYQFGLLCDKLKQHHFYDNTNIFVWSDHGDYTTDYGIAEKVQNCFDDCISNVPLLVKPAKETLYNAGVSQELVELVDLPATFADIAGFDLSYVQFGKSLLPTLQGDAHKGYACCEGGRVHGEIQAMERGHGPESPYWPRLSTQSSEGPEHTKACMIRMGKYKYTMRLYEKDEFYDLEKDPMELYNAIDDPAYQDTIQNMKQQLLTWYMETGDYVPNRKDKR